MTAAREVQRQERRIQQKEESLDKKMESLEAKDEVLTNKCKQADERLAEAEAVKKANSKCWSVSPVLQ